MREGAVLNGCLLTVATFQASFFGKVFLVERRSSLAHFWNAYFVLVLAIVFLSERNVVGPFTGALVRRQAAAFGEGSKMQNRCKCACVPKISHVSEALVLESTGRPQGEFYEDLCGRELCFDCALRICMKSHGRCRISSGEL